MANSTSPKPADVNHPTDPGSVKISETSTVTKKSDTDVEGGFTHVAPPADTDVTVYDDTDTKDDDNSGSVEDHLAYLEAWLASVNTGLLGVHYVPFADRDDTEI